MYDDYDYGYDYGGDSYLDDWDTQYLNNQDWGGGVDLSGIYDLPTYNTDIFDLPGTSFELGMSPTFESTGDWGNLFSLSDYQPSYASWDLGSPSSYSWSDIQSPDLGMAADLGYDFTSAPNISFYDQAAELQDLEDRGVINALQKEEILGQLRQQYDTAYQGYDTPRAFTTGLTGYEGGPGAFYKTGLADTSGSGNLYWDAGRNEWVTEGGDIPNITITGSGQQSQAPSGLTWNPDKGWVDPKTGDVVYSGANAGEDFTPYGMTLGFEGPDTSWDTANGLGQTAKSLGLTWDPDRGWINVGGQVVTPDQAVTTLEGVEAITDSTGRIVATRDPYTGAITRTGGAFSSQEAFTKAAQAAAEQAVKDLMGGGQKETKSPVQAAIEKAVRDAVEGRTKQQPSKARGVMNIAQSVLRMLQAATSKNQNPTQARGSSVQDIGPRAQGARPVRTLYAKGGKVELPSEAMGGLLPLTLKIAEHMLGATSGRHSGLIGGEEGGQDDVVDIKAAPGEYIIDAEVVSALGDGNNANGASKLDKMRYNIRKHKRTGGLTAIAPRAKSPEQYLKGK